MVKCLVNGLLPEYANRILGFVFLVLFIKFEKATYHRVFCVCKKSTVSTKVRPRMAIWLLPQIILFFIGLSAKGFVSFHFLAMWIRLIRLGTRGAPRSWHLGILSSLTSEQGLGIPSQKQKACGSSSHQEADCAKQEAGSFLRCKKFRRHIVICQLLMLSCTELVLGSAQLQ